jgi:hypothetical protein
MHPHQQERDGDRGFEPTVDEHLRLGRFVAALDQAGEDELRQIAKQMAAQVLMTYPAAMRWLAKEAARNLGGQPWSQESSDRLVAALRESTNKGAS